MLLLDLGVWVAHRKAICPCSMVAPLCRAVQDPRAVQARFVEQQRKAARRAALATVSRNATKSKNKGKRKGDTGGIGGGVWG